MKLIEVDEKKCKRDGLCAADCPARIIRLKDQNSFPEVRQGEEEACIRCGHCVSVCPHGALSHLHIPRGVCPPIRKDLAVDREQVVQLLRSRRSIRQYRDVPVEREKIQELIEIARYAPTGGNTEAVEWRVYADKKELRRFSGMTVDWMRKTIQSVPLANLPPYFPAAVTGWDAGEDTILRDAPVMILALAPAESPNGLVDLTIALTYLQLAAMPLGLGTCWAGMIRRALLLHSPLREAVGIPEKSPQFYPMMLGYPKVSYHRVPERKPPKIEWK
jgi:nitroreductase/NAD-dependent dihydropyrimidine dehydrogenase PreA subunit